MSKTSIKKICKIVFLIVAISFMLLHMISIPINKKYDAIEIKLDDPSYLEKCTVSMKGSYQFNILSEDTFKGQITVSTYPRTYDKMEKVDVTREGDCSGTLWYGTYESLYPFAMLSSDMLLNNIVLLVKSNPMYEDNKSRPLHISVSWGSDDGYCIVPSVSTREDAIEKLSELGWVYKP